MKDKPVIESETIHMGGCEKTTMTRDIVKLLRKKPAPPSEDGNFQNL